MPSYNVSAYDYSSDVSSVCLAALQASKQALKKFGPLLNAEVVKNILDHHINSGTLHYGEFINFISKAIVGDLPFIHF